MCPIGSTIPTGAGRPTCCAPEPRATRRCWSWTSATSTGPWSWPSTWIAPADPASSGEPVDSGGPGLVLIRLFVQAPRRVVVTGLSTALGAGLLVTLLEYCVDIVDVCAALQRSGFLEAPVSPLLHGPNPRSVPTFVGSVYPLRRGPRHILGISGFSVALMAFLRVPCPS